MPSRRQVRAYDQYEIESLKGVPIPPKIACGRCRKHLPQTKYSTKQLTDLRYQMKHEGRCTKAINCQPCTGNQIVEIECTMCHKTKGLEDFARSQRNKPDTAKCFKCTEDQVTHQPIDHDRYEDTSRSQFVTPDTSNGFSPDYWSSCSTDPDADSAWASINGDGNTREALDGGVALSHHFRRAASINGSGTETLIDTDSDVSFPSRNGNNDGWSEVRTGRTASWHTRSTAAGSASVGSNFNPNAYGRPSAASNSGTQRTYASSVAERSDTSEALSNGWPSIRAYRPDQDANTAAATARVAANGSAGPIRSPFVRPSEDTQREIAEAWAGSDEEEEEGENDEDNSDDSDGDNTII